MKRLLFVITLLAVAVLVCGCSLETPESATVHFVVDGKLVTDMDAYSYRVWGLNMGQKEGYTFDGWYVDPEFTQVARPASAKEETTVYGRWVEVEKEAIRYNIRFCDEDGTLLSQTTATTIADIRFPDSPVKEGYLFAGWKGLPDKLTGSISLLAIYTPVYSVIFVDEDGTQLKTEMVAQGNAATPPATPNKEDDDAYTYTFAGWRSADGDYTNVQCDMTVSARFDSASKMYSYVFHLQNGEEDVSGSAAFNSTIRVAVPDKADYLAVRYTFAGWDTDGDGVADRTTNNIRIKEPFEAWAVYTESVVTHTVSYVVEGSTVAKYTVQYGEDAPYMGATPTKEADAQYTYTFAQWDGEALDVVEDLEIHALFDATINTYRYVFADGDVIYSEQVDVPYGTTIVVPMDPTRAPTQSHVFAFKGWVGYQEDMVLTRDSYFEAQFEEETRYYSVRFVDGQTNRAIVYALPYGALIEQAPFPQDDRYLYEWRNFVSGEHVEGDCDYTLKRTFVYRLYWWLDADTLYATTQVLPGGAPLVPDNDPTLDGYDFEGWQVDLSSPVEQDLNYTALWSKQESPEPDPLDPPAQDAQE